MHTYTHTCVNSAHTHGINKEVECGKQISKDLKRPARLHKNISCMQYTNKFAPRSAASWVAWRAVASLAARGCAFAWRQSIGGGGAATSDSGAHQLTDSLMQVPKVSRVLGGMAGSSILGRTWLCLRVEAINRRRRGSHIRQWRTSVDGLLDASPQGQPRPGWHGGQ